MKIYSLLAIKILILLSLSSCALFQEENIIVVAEPTEREKLFLTAEKYFIVGNDEAAKPIYFKLTRASGLNSDSVYDNSLWRLVKIYEKANEPEKAILTLGELFNNKNNYVSKNKIKFALMKNHFLVDNTSEAEKIKKEIDDNYKTRMLTLYEIYESCLDSTEFNYNYLVYEELVFLSEIQKYFVFVIESDMNPENARLTERLIQNYDQFFEVISRDITPSHLKKKLQLNLYAQLKNINTYKIDEAAASKKSVLKLSAYVNQKIKILTESLHQ